MIKIVRLFRRIALIAPFVLSLPFGAHAQQNLSSNPAYAEYANDIYNNPASPSFGDLNADVTIVEYYDYQCSHCKASEEALERLMQEDGNVRLVLKDFPKLGPMSDTAAIITLASARQGVDKYYRFHSALMNRQVSFSSEAYIYQVANAVGLDVEKLRQDTENPAIRQLIQDNIAVGRSVGVQMTPTFIVNGYLFPGEADYNRLKEFVAYARSSHHGNY